MPTSTLVLALSLLLPRLDDPASRGDATFAVLNGERLLLADFHAFVGFEYRRDGKFEADRQALFQEIAIRRDAERRHLVVSPAQLDQRYAILDNRARQEQRRGLDTILAEQGVPLERFREGLEAALLLEQMVRDDFDLGGDAEPPEDKLEVWLQDRMARAKVVRTELPPHLMAIVDGVEVTLEEYGERLLLGMGKNSPTRRGVETAFLEAHAVRQYAEARGIVVDAEIIDAEIEARERKMRERPGMADVELEDVLAETGSTIDQLRRSLRFTTRLRLERLVDEIAFPGADLWLFYRSHRESFDRLYGEQVDLAAIFKKAGQPSAEQAGFVPRTFDEAMQELEELKARIESGTFGFEAAARSRSDDAFSGQRGGRLGVIGPATPGRGALAAQVLAARRAGVLPESGLLGPLRMEDGVYLVKSLGFVPGRDFQSLLPEIRKHAMNELLRAIAAAAVVER
jgi:hypothetical protein